MNILIVDDSKMNIKIAQDTLIEYCVPGDIIGCLSGEEALEILENDVVDLILLDIIMPGISGLDFLKIISGNGVLERVKVIMLTTVDDLQVLKQCFELGATDYIRKPFDKLEFVVRVNSVINEIENNKACNDALEQASNQIDELKRLHHSLNIMYHEALELIGHSVDELIVDPTRDKIENLSAMIHRFAGYEK